MSATKSGTKTGSPTLAAKFGVLGVGKQRLRLGVAFERSTLTAQALEDLFVHANLSVALELRPTAAKDMPGQNTLDVGAIRLVVDADTAGYRISEDGVSVSLAMARGDVDLLELAQFAGQEGAMVCTRVGDATPAELDSGEV